MSPDNCLPVLVCFHSPTKKFHHNYSKTRGPLSQHVWHIYLYLFEFILLPLAFIRAQIGERLLISTLLSNLLFFLSSSVIISCHDWTSIPGIIKPWCCLLLPDYCIIPPCIYFWIFHFTLGGWIDRFKSYDVVFYTDISSLLFTDCFFRYFSCYLPIYLFCFQIADLKGLTVPCVRRLPLKEHVYLFADYTWYLLDILNLNLQTNQQVWGKTCEAASELL